mmetsp:Transcript_5310/g.22550  ORF Transcript_5310/g.22550 Transcript_5310/m.22550 type:complete len:81 (-) Transcript_5310:515-757(-)
MADISDRVEGLQVYEAGVDVASRGRQNEKLSLKATRNSARSPAYRRNKTSYTEKKLKNMEMTSKLRMTTREPVWRGGSPK